MSTHQTSLPSSAKPAAVTRPTYPVPMTAMGSRSEAMRADEGTRGGPRTDPCRGSASGSGQRGRDIQHLLVAEIEAERVRDPVDGLGGAPGDQPQLATVEVQLEPLAANVADFRRRGEDRRALPGRALDAVERAHGGVERQHEPVGGV